jgi:hypothetical protein
LKLLRHAVSATLVATVGDRDTQVGNAVAMSILHQRNFTIVRWLNQESETIDSTTCGCMIF